MNISEIQKLSPLDQIIAVNNYINDLVLYKPDDSTNEWQDLHTTLDRRTGDCEDFAIAKFTLLTRLQSPYSFRIAIVRDFGQNHSVCLAIPPNSPVEAALVLDNNSFTLTPLNQTHYGLLLSFNWSTLFIGNRQFTSFVHIDKWNNIVSQYNPISDIASKS